MTVVSIRRVCRSWLWHGLRDTKLIATDCDWTAGSGIQDLRGPLADLILVATGRPAGLPTLTGTATQRLATTLKG